MDDTISRQAAIDALHMHLMYRMGTDSNKKRLDDWINGVPSAQPERKKGYMKIKVISALDGEGLFCENCNAYCLSPLYNFCPKCGVEFIGVRGEQND